MHAAVDHVQHRHRQGIRLRPAEPAEERDAGLVRRGLGNGQRGAEHRVGAQAALVGSSVERDQLLVDAALIVRIGALERRGDLAVDVGYCLVDGLAQINALVAVAKLDRLMHTGGSTGRDDGPALAPRLEYDVDLYRRVPARVENLAAVH